MSKNLIIVESPAKARTITKYLGKEFKALASYGHVRDLLPKKGAVDPEQGFSMQYEIVDRNKKHVDTIARELKKADALYLATDPDREGEAISWHLYELLKERNLLKNIPVHRVVFYEITPNAIRDAVANPRQLSQDLINAQQARRALDYLVGFNLSPLLWKKVRQGLSAGRVQSPALRLICEREAEIDAFTAREYWTVVAELTEKSKEFTAKLTHFATEKLTQFSIENQTRAGEVTTTLEHSANGELIVQKIDKKQRKRNPSPPFTTSTLQQEGSRKLGFSALRTMRVAQQLYEGVAIEGESVGLITYMRTDSVNLGGEAIAELRDFIAKNYGPDNVPERPQTYKNRSKNAQEAHEAIRPTSASRTPESIKNALDQDQFRLYELIWKRAVASQMIHATLDTVAVDFSAGESSEGHMFRATGSTIRIAGFMTLYQEDEDDTAVANGGAASDSKQGVLLPEFRQGQRVNLKKIVPNQHFTEPPPRYTEASLVKTLEAYGIGRPSTYASIITTLVNREYAELESRRFTPTDIGKIVNGFLTDHFTRYVDYDFTAKLEDELDAVSRGEKEWLPIMRSFWKDFDLLVKDKETSVTREQVAQSRALGIDPASGRPLSVRMGRYGPFAQIGTKDDEEKPKWAGLRPGQKMDAITLEEALELFKLPRELGETAEGEPVSTNFGRFGPYVKYGSKYVSIKDEDPYTITLERALEKVKEKKEADANRIIQTFEQDGIQVLNGRYGPYITNGEKNARAPKDKEPQALTLEECKELLEKAPAKRARGGKKTTKKKTAKSDTGDDKSIKKKKSKKKSSKKKTKRKTKKKTAKKVSKKSAANSNSE